MIPERYKNAEYESVPEQIRALCKSMGESRKGIYLHGSVGTGKTHFAYAIKKHHDKPETGRFAMLWNMTELLHDMRKDFDAPYGEKMRPEESIMAHKWLVIIDDVGAEKISDWVAETFYLIVNRRYEDMLPTIFTSNLNPQALADRIGDRTVSRIVEMCDVVEISGTDRRITNVKSNKVNV